MMMIILVNVRKKPIVLSEIDLEVIITEKEKRKNTTMRHKLIMKKGPKKKMMMQTQVTFQVQVGKEVSSNRS